jgi:hypothetical protein
MAKPHETIWSIYEKQSRFVGGQPTWRRAHSRFETEEEAKKHLEKLDSKRTWAIRKRRIKKQR